MQGTRITDHLVTPFQGHCLLPKWCSVRLSFHPFSMSLLILVVALAAAKVGWDDLGGEPPGQS